MTSEPEPAMLSVVAATPHSRLSHWRVGDSVPASDYIVLLNRDHLTSVRWSLGHGRGGPIPVGTLELGLDASGAAKLGSVRRADRRRLLGVLVAGRLLTQTFLAKAAGSQKLILVSTQPTITARLLDATQLRLQ